MRAKLPEAPTGHARDATAPLAQDIPEGARPLLKYAVAALARRDHGRVELERKLLRRLSDGAGPADVRWVLDRLAQRGYLSDARAAQALARARASRYGRARIEQELERRGVDADSIRNALPSTSDEAATALALWQRRFGQLPATAAERARQGRFLVARGFAFSLVSRILSGRLQADS